jgi:hypothetical protein
MAPRGPWQNRASGTSQSFLVRANHYRPLEHVRLFEIHHSCIIAARPRPYYEYMHSTGMQQSCDDERSFLAPYLWMHQRSTADFYSRLRVPDAVPELTGFHYSKPHTGQ